MLAADFLRGDTDSSGRLTITDAIRTLSFLFLGEAAAVTCKDAADADDNGQVNLSDPLFILTSLFQRGSAPAAPFPVCGEDPTEDALDCAEWKECPPPFEFFGFDFQGGAVFFVIDRSGTQQDNGELAGSKSETVEAISAFPDGVQFGVLFVDRGLLNFPSSGIPAEANPEMRAAAIAWVQSIAGGGGSCDILGLLEAVTMARQTRSAEKLIFYLGDGGGTCDGRDEADYLAEMRRVVTEANAGLAHLHTIARGPTGPRQKQHLQELAAMNGGAYHETPP